MSFGFVKFASISPKQLMENQDCNRKNEKLAKWGSKMDSILPSHENCEKNDRGFFPHPIMEKNLSFFSKCILVCPESHSEIAWSKMLRKRFFFRQGGIPDPPEVVSGFFLGGRWIVEMISVRCWFYETTLFQTPPLVKVRMAEGVSELFFGH
jgi:hypothetical protein